MLDITLLGQGMLSFEAHLIWRPPSKNALVPQCKACAMVVSQVGISKRIFKGYCTELVLLG